MAVCNAVRLAYRKLIARLDILRDKLNESDTSAPDDPPYDDDEGDDASITRI